MSDYTYQIEVHAPESAAQSWLAVLHSRGHFVGSATAPTPHHALSKLVPTVEQEFDAHPITVIEKKED